MATNQTTEPCIVIKCSTLRSWLAWLVGAATMAVVTIFLALNDPEHGHWHMAAGWSCGAGIRWLLKPSIKEQTT